MRGGGQRKQRQGKQGGEGIGGAWKPPVWRPVYAAMPPQDCVSGVAANALCRRTRAIAGRTAQATSSSARTGVA